MFKHRDISQEILCLHMVMVHGEAGLKLSSSDFLSKRWGLIWEAIQKRFNAGLGISLREIAKAADLTDEEIDRFSSAQDTEYSMNLCKSDLTGLAEDIREAAIGRKCRDIAAKVTEYQNGSEMLSTLLSELQKLQSDNVSANIRHISEVADTVWKQLKDNSRVPVGIPTGLQSLDLKFTFRGLPRSQPTILAGATSSGKSALANTCLHSAASRGLGVLCCAFEDSPEVVLKRTFSNVCQINNTTIQRNEINEEELRRVGEAIVSYGASNVFFLEQVPPTVNELCSIIRSHVSKYSTDLVIIDFLQLIRSGIRSRTRQDDVDHIYGQIVQTARQIEAATLIVSQLKRTRNKKPTKEDLYHSGAIEQWSHTIGLLWRPETEDQNHIALIVDKQKNGPTGTIILGWDPEFMCYTDPDPYAAERYKNEIEKLNDN